MFDCVAANARDGTDFSIRKNGSTQHFYTFLSNRTSGGLRGSPIRFTFMMNVCNKRVAN